MNTNECRHNASMVTPILKSSGLLMVAQQKTGDGITDDVRSMHISRSPSLAGVDMQQRIRRRRLGSSTDDLFSISKSPLLDMGCVGLRTGHQDSPVY